MGHRSKFRRTHKQGAEERRPLAEERQAARRQRSVKEQIQLLRTRPGNSEREIERLSVMANRT